MEHCQMSRKAEVTRSTIEQQQAADPGSSVWVSANAGSGKTHVLVDRLIRMLLGETDPSTILCLTYTKAAAAEMAERLFQRLGQWAVLSDVALRQQIAAIGGTASDLKMARQLFTRALETPGGLKIQTIHAFCQNLLHLFPVEAGLAPGFKVMDDAQALTIRGTVWSQLQQQIALEPESAAAEAFQSIEPFFDEQRFQKAIASLVSEPSRALKAVTEHLDPDQLLHAARRCLGVSGSDPDQLRTEAVTWDTRVLANYINTFSPYEPFRKLYVVEMLRSLQITDDVSQRLAILRELVFKKEGEPRKQILRKAAIDDNPVVASLFDADLRQRSSIVVNIDLHERAQLSASLWLITGLVSQGYEREKRKRGLYDFSDLIARVANLLSTRDAAQWVLYKLDHGINHILVDEGQDTSPDQWAIIDALTQEFFAGKGARQDANRTVFVVGDRKQSIFSFQGADAAQFEQVRGGLRSRVMASDKPFRDVKLQVSYRSVPEILTFVDTILPPGQQQNMGIDDVSSAEDHQSSRLDKSGLVELWPLICPLEKEEPDAWDAPVDHVGNMAPRKRLARQIAETVAGWVGTRILTAEDRPVQPDDILILVQRRGALFSYIIAELRRAGVPVAGADRLTLARSLAVMDLLALAQAIILRSDDYSLACVLKSPLLTDPLSEEELYALAYNRGTASLWSRLAASDQPRCKIAAAALDLLAERATRLGPYEFFANILNASRIRMVARLGPEAVDATDAFLDQALHYEQTNDSSLAGFVTWFQSEDIEIKREMDQAKGEVRIMSAHSSKGLQANIVILPDASEIHANPYPPPFTWTETGLPIVTTRNLSSAPIIEDMKQQRAKQDHEESVRLLYVAMTRARNELYICGSLGKNKLNDRSWYSIIEEALAVRPLAFREVRVDSCEFDTVRRFGSDPVSIEREKQPRKPVINPLWAPPSSLLDQLAPKRETVVGLSAFDPAQAPLSAPVTSKAATRGENIHTLLRQLPNWPEAARLPAGLRRGAQLGLDPETVYKLVALVARSDLQPFFAPGSRGEVKMMIADTAGPRELRLDRLALHDDAVYVLDYKTGKPQELSENHMYVQQLAGYSQALQGAWPGRRVKAAILWTDTGNLDWLFNQA
jgi:ATP-dependent helicase/nuclease subunit A